MASLRPKEKVPLDRITPDDLPNAESLARMKKQIAGIVQAFAPYRQRRRLDKREMARLPHKADAPLARVAELARLRHAFPPPGIVAMEASRALSLRVAELRTAAEHAVEVLRAIELDADAVAWRHMTAAYAVLGAMAKHDATIEDELESVRDFFRARRRGKKKRAGAAQKKPRAK